MLSLLSIHALMDDTMDELVKTLTEVRDHINDEEKWDTAEWEILRTELEG
jgi:hypothetical protein